LIESSSTVQNLTDWPTTLTSYTSNGVNIPAEMIIVGGGLGIIVIAALVISVKKR
jgi:subtilase family serine protease